MTLYYREERQCSWTAQPGVADNLGHLVLVLRRKDVVAIHCSDPRMRDRILGEIKTDGALATILHITSAKLNKAFVTGTRPRTMWLVGIHRRTSTKADGKVLTGVDLRDALDPLEDQSYQFSSIRCSSDLAGVPIGVSPRRSRIWAGSSEDWPDFRRTVERILEHLASTAGNDAAPLPVLAASEPGDPSGAFDVALIPDELFGSDPDLDADARAEMEAISDHTLLEVINRSGADFAARVSLAGHVLGELTVEVDASDPGHVVLDIGGAAASSEVEDIFKEIRSRVRRKSWLKVRYESGHTISDGALFAMRYRDMPFTGFLWANLRDCDVTQEKPSQLSEIGQQRSLFCWIQRFWPSVRADILPHRGWLVCDDGSMEIADFIHLDLSHSPPQLSLIHVKASKSDLKNRPISVSPFEVVTGQAVKNIRHLDQLLLADGLRRGLGKRISNLVWHDGIQSTRAAMVEALSGLGANYGRQVVILQPQITHVALTHAREHSRSQDAARLRQLDTLLIGASAACRNVSAAFFVIGDEQTAQAVTVAELGS